ncbi:hypothetical protein ACS0TY_010297 [Phlomoides rotata]
MCGKYATNGSTPSHHDNENGSTPNHQLLEAIVNLDHGDPTMYEWYWREVGERCSVTLSGFECLSYFANARNVCWFLEAKLEEEIHKVHQSVGNAVTENRHVVVGTGSSQLILAAIYALSSHPLLHHPNPVNVVSAAPYYSAYPEMTDILRSRLFKWGGDARCFNEEGPYIELVTSPNNPDGVMREAMVKGGGKGQGQGMLIHDLAYYWPQYTAITSPLDHDIMLFTISKCTGHAGSRIGWAVVKDENVARKMVKFMEVSTIGVSKEAQLRAANILETISLSLSCQNSNELDNFFQHSRRLLAERWNKLRDSLKSNPLFHLSKYPTPYCNFFKKSTETYPAFAWMKCKEGLDCEKLLREHKILTRSGTKFGSEAEYVRISMLGRDEEFDVFVQRLQTIQD